MLDCGLIYKQTEAPIPYALTCMPPKMGIISIIIVAIITILSTDTSPYYLPSSVFNFFMRCPSILRDERRDNKSGSRQSI